MIREILTLEVDGMSTQYYIQFGKDRTRFSFQPTLKNKAAPSFTLIVKDGNIEAESPVPASLARQASEKIRSILDDKLFDKF
jgi:hypothetical protein